ncbi:MAG: hypothetical protein KDA28_12650, partial [Phycisphaerales bacterium]|nr:hypothetical protein [Phycisphaerales bacterium]
MKFSAIALVTLAGTALADRPDAMDRVPSDAYLVASVNNVQAFATEITEMTEALNIPGVADELGMFMGMMTNIPGLDATGSAAFAIVGDNVDFDADEGPVVAVLPVKNFDEFVQALEGTPGAGVIELNMNGETVFARNIGGGYAAVGPMADVLSGFDGAAGNHAGFESRMGKAGTGIADASDVTIVVNITAMEPQLREGFEGFRGNMEMVGAMSGQDMGPQVEMMSAGFEAFMRDARAGIMGLNLNEGGVGFDLAVNFAEGSQMALASTGESDSSAVLKGVPDMPFLFAWSMDFSNATTKDFMKAMSAMNPGTGNMLASMMDQVDGMSGVMGSVPAVFGGLFSNTVMYWQTDNPGEFRKGV